MRKKITLQVHIEEDMDELFGNFAIYTMHRRHILRVDRKYIPLNELTEERIAKEVKDIL